MKTLKATIDAVHALVRRGIPMALVGLSVLFASAGARAACGSPARLGSGMAPRMPFLAQMTGGVSQAGSSSSIVGLWHVSYVSDGALFYEAFDQWHSDGTEFENAYAIPTEGNVCEGVWKQIAPRTIKLNHIGWNFDADGNPAGTFTLTEINAVSSDGASYKGTFDYKLFDVNGNLLDEIKGTQTASRITVTN